MKQRKKSWNWTVNTQPRTLVPRAGSFHIMCPVSLVCHGLFYMRIDTRGAYTSFGWAPTVLLPGSTLQEEEEGATPRLWITLRGESQQKVNAKSALASDSHFAHVGEARESSKGREICEHERKSVKKHLDKYKEGCSILNKCGTGKKCRAYLNGKVKIFQLSKGWSDNEVTFLLPSPLSQGNDDPSPRHLLNFCFWYREKTLENPRKAV